MGSWKKGTAGEERRRGRTYTHPSVEPSLPRISLVVLDKSLYLPLYLPHRASGRVEGDDICKGQKGGANPLCLFLGAWDSLR